jgi:hypothetical protein
MDDCGHLECFISTPPTLEFLLETFPLITPDKVIDRSIPRCRLCDLLGTRTRETAAVYPPPTYLSAIERLQKYIASTEKLITEGVRKAELEATLPSMKQMLADEIKVTELRLLEAWKGHWAIWGAGDGPDVSDEYIEEENEPEFVVEEEPQKIEEKPQKIVGKKRKAPLKIKGRASPKRAKRA